MAIKWEDRPFTHVTSSGSSSTLTEEIATTADDRIVAVRTITDDGAGGFVGGMGAVDYVGKTVALKVVSHDRTTTAYKSDHEDAEEFDRVTENDGEGSSSSGGRKGGEYTTAAVGEEMLAGYFIIAKYRVGAPAARAVTQTFTPPSVVLDLCRYTSHRIVPGSVQFRWMGVTYVDFEGLIYRGRTDTDAGIASGAIDYAEGTARMWDYVVGGSGPADFQLQSLWTQAGQWSTASLFFNTEVAPLRAGAGGFVLTVVDTQGSTLTANVDGQGKITGSHMLGRIEFSRGGVELQFGDFVLDADLSAADKAEWWYSAAVVGAFYSVMVCGSWSVLVCKLG